MILKSESGFAVVKSQGHVGNAGLDNVLPSVPRQRLSDARAVLTYFREVATAPHGPNGTPMTVIPFEAATP